MTLAPFRLLASPLRASSRTAPGFLRPFDEEFFHPFDRFFRDTNMRRAGGFGALDVRETPTHHIVQADMSGMTADQIKVSVKDGVLTFSGERTNETTHGEKDSENFYTERTHGSFARSITLPDNVDASTIEAGVKQGVLEIKIPKTEPTEPSKIEIDVKQHD
eukprot:m.47607 g.47607  ORF g.47607 m.47607 type:complete len:162 (-) comp17678_c0_seq3:134-619(-)